MLSVLARILHRVRVNSYLTSSFRYRGHLIFVVAVAAVIAVAMYGSTVSVRSRELTVVRAEGRGKGFFNFRDGRELAVEYRGSERAVTALRNGQATAAAMALADLDNNGTLDLISGYSSSGIGLVTVQHGNPEAYAPLDESIYPKLQRGYNPEALLPGADAYEAPITIDHLVAGNFTDDAQKDVVIASAGGGLYLLRGDGRGRLGNPEQLALSGTITSLIAGEFAAADGRTDLAVGVVGSDGPVVELFDGGAENFSEPASVVHLSAPANAITFGSLDDDPFIDMAIAAGNQITILHGAGRKQLTPVANRTERISLSSGARSIAIGNFTWDRAGRDEIAVVADDGAVHVMARGRLDTRPYTDADRPNRGRWRPRVSQRNVDIETLSGWTASEAQSWNETAEVATGAVSPQLFSAAKISHGETTDLLVGGSDQALHVVHAGDVNQKQSGEIASATSGLTSVTLDAVAPVVDAVVMPRKLNGEGGLVLLSKQSAAPAMVPLAVTATIDVDRTDDNAAASACTIAANDCSLRGAITNANSNVDLTVINVPANTYVLSIAGSGGCDGNAVGDLDINEDTNILGAGSATTIIRQTASGVNGDRVMCLNTGFLENIDYQFSGVTITGGRDNNSGFGGGGIIGGERLNTHQFTNVVISNNQANGGNIGGGGIQITGGDVTFTSSTIGGSNAPGADRNDPTLANQNVNSSGAGIYFTPSAPTHAASTGNLITNNTVFSRNVAGSLSEGGGGADVGILNIGAGVGTGTATFTNSTQFNNNSANPANGGGLIVASLPTTVSGASFTSNSAAGQGGGIYVGSSTLLLDGSVSATTFTGNTASANGGSSISVNNTTTVSGTMVSIGGDVVVNGQGNWTNNNGSTLAPTNFLMFGGTFNGNNSTMNISGNLTMQPQSPFGVTFNAGSSTINLAGNFSWTAGGTTPVGSFNAGTGTFNFNGSGAQSISNTATITFNNLTNSNVTQPLTANNSFNVNGALNVNGGNAIFDPVAAAVIGGSGTLTGTGTARVRSLSGFSSQYTITNKTLTNLTVEYIGSGLQTVSAITYGGLKMNNASGGNLAAGTTTVNGTLTLTLGAVNVGSQTLVIANGTSLAAGSITSAATGTVNYSQASNGQNVLAFNYGNLTFSNFDKVLASTGTIRIAGTFTPGTATGHTITGSTVEYNGTAAQILPNTFTTYNNLTLNNPAGVTGFPGLTVQGLLLVASGTFTSSSNYNNVQINAGATLAGVNATTINVSGNWTNNGGTFTPNGNTVNFNGAGAQTIGGTGSSTFNNLTVSNANGLSMASDNTVNGILALSAGDITVAANNVLTQPASGSSTGTFDVVGSLKRTGFVSGGAALSFGNPFNSIQINSGTAPTDITVNLVKTTPPNPIGFPNAVERTYTITPNGGSGISATLRLHYLDSELNGNTEGAGLNLWQFVAPLWRPRTITAFDTTDNWVEKSGITSFSPWTMNSLSPTATNGTVSGSITNPDGSPVVGAVVRLTGTQNRKTITDANGVYRFADVETSGFYTVVPTRANYSFSPAQRSFNQVGESTEASFSGTSGGDNQNPLDTAEYFIRQQYVDLLGREPDEGGFNYWSDRILECGADTRCVSARRRDVAAAFFVEQEFQQTGSFIYGLYKGGLGRLPAYNEFTSDRTGLVVGPQLDAMKQAYAEAFVGRSEFVSKYAANTTAESFVDALLANVFQASGIDLSGQRSSLIGHYNAGGTREQSRSFAVRELTESAAFRQPEFNAGFVLTEYFGYLRRDPDQGGYDFWLNVLNNREPGNLRGMVCAFITSAEYQQRFSSIVSRSDQECGQ